MSAAPDILAFARLRDETVVTVRPLREDDGALIRSLYASLSDASKYRRFMTLRGPLTDDEVRFFTHTDGHTHVAFLATVAGSDGEEIAVGAARFIRLADDPSVAEPAVAVADAWHHRGVGGALLLRLIAEASSCGITTLRAHILAGNDPVQRLLRKWPGTHRSGMDGPVWTYDVPLRQRVA